MLQTLVRTDDEWTPLITRLALGLVMFPHGAQKMLGWFGGSGFSGTMEAMTGQGLPAVVVFLVIIGEFFGSLGLIFGFLSRVAAGGIGVIMLGAVATVHGSAGFFMDWYNQGNPEGYEYHILAIGLALAVILKGAGKLSVDRALTK